jgi:hypothetical protein
MKKIILSSIIIISFVFPNESIAQNLCHKGRCCLSCFTTEIVEKTKELKLVSENTPEVTLMFKYLNSPKEGEKIYSNNKNKLLVYFDGDQLISVKLQTNIKFGVILFEKGLYSQPAD